MRVVVGTVLVLSMSVACGGGFDAEIEDLSGAYAGSLTFTLQGTGPDCSGQETDPGASVVLVRQPDGKYVLTVISLVEASFTMIRSANGAESETPVSGVISASELSASLTSNALRDELNLTLISRRVDVDCTTTGVGVLKRTGGGADAGQ
jgi:hypothetical protein